jgi:hypothetical protein
LSTTRKGLQRFKSQNDGVITNVIGVRLPDCRAA